MGETVLRAKDGPIATITINRPEVMNALDLDTMRALLEACKAVEDDEEVRAVVLKGAGRAFVAGGDVGQFRRMIDQPDFPIEDAIEVLQSVTRSIMRHAQAGSGQRAGQRCRGGLQPDVCLRSGHCRE